MLMISHKDFKSMWINHTDFIQFPELEYLFAVHYFKEGWHQSYRTSGSIICLVCNQHRFDLWHHITVPFPQIIPTTRSGDP